MNKVATVKIGGGAEYAKVADRIKLFWEENPNGKIDTERENCGDDKIRFVARIWRNASNIEELVKSSASVEAIKMTANACASADAIKHGDKENEKLETVAVGRALAMLGYLASGEVASREEMDAFEAYKAQKWQEDVDNYIKQLNAATTIEQLRNVFISIPIDMRSCSEVIIAKNDCKDKLLNAKEGVNESS